MPVPVRDSSPATSGAGGSSGEGSLNDTLNSSHSDAESKLEDLHFSPPLYLQRYDTVSKVSFSQKILGFFIFDWSNCLFSSFRRFFCTLTTKVLSN